MVRIVQINDSIKQQQRSILADLCKMVQLKWVLVQEPYFRKGNFYLGNLLNPVFAPLSKNEMVISRVMPRDCVLVYNETVATLISELTTRDVYAVTILDQHLKRA